MMERGLEFYVILAAVAVGALTWFYKKGSRIWTTVRKLRRSQVGQVVHFPEDFWNFLRTASRPQRMDPMQPCEGVYPRPVDPD